MSRESLSTRLQVGLAHLDMQISAEAQARLIAYLLLLEKWNKSFNLTAIRDVNEMLTKHVLDSLSIFPLLQGQRFVDVGTGAGLPGMVLAIVRPDTHWCLIDSNQKKTRFLQQAVIELELENVTVRADRAEDVTDLGQFDMVTCRAVAELDSLIAATRHLSTCLLAMKGHIPEEELNALPESIQVDLRLLQVPELEADRCAVILRQ